MTSLSSSLAQDDAGASVPTFETLVQHLLAAKRSLGCVEHVSRANGLVTNTRQVLEQQTIQNARAEFLHAGSVAQTQVLQQIQRHTQGLFQDNVAEFAGIVKSFEQAEARLNATLDQLRATIVEKALRPDGEAAKSLADFIDETGVQGLKDTVQESIDAFTEARQDFEKNAGEFDDEVAEARELLSDAPSVSDSSLHDAKASPLPSILHRMESHAQDMASNLESLVSHFDLCITAIRHTDGGGATASQFTDELPDALRQQLQPSGGDDAALEPLDPAERHEMLHVLTTDAAEVDAVVAEIRTSLAQMETEYEAVDRAAATLATRTERAAAALQRLDDLGAKLPRYLTQSQLFGIRGDAARAGLADRLAEFAGLGDFYDAFLAAYAALLVEVGRRKDTERRLDKVRADAVAKMERLLAEEVAERAHFRSQQGDFLPADIWPGLVASPGRWEWRVVDGAEDLVPDISASTINRAIRSLEKGERSGSSK